MHADIQQLIALRDGEPVDAHVAGHVNACPACGERQRQLSDVRAALGELRDEAPPPDAWSQIVALRALETTPPAQHPVGVRRFGAVAALAVAAIALGVALSALNGGRDRLGMDVDPPTLSELQIRSRELEYALQSYRSAGVMSLRTAGAINELEDSIALIDYQLTGADGDETQRRLWEQRVELMETLVMMRAAERYADSI